MKMSNKKRNLLFQLSMACLLSGAVITHTENLEELREHNKERVANYEVPVSPYGTVKKADATLTENEYENLQSVIIYNPITDNITITTYQINENTETEITESTLPLALADEEIQEYINKNKLEMGIGSVVIPLKIKEESKDTTEESSPNKNDSSTSTNSNTD